MEDSLADVSTRDLFIKLQNMQRPSTSSGANVLQLHRSPRNLRSLTLGRRLSTENATPRTMIPKIVESRKDKPLAVHSKGIPLKRKHAEDSRDRNEEMTKANELEDDSAQLETDEESSDSDIFLTKSPAVKIQKPQKDKTKCGNFRFSIGGLEAESDEESTDSEVIPSKSPAVKMQKSRKEKSKRGNFRFSIGGLAAQKSEQASGYNSPVKVTPTKDLASSDVKRKSILSPVENLRRKKSKNFVDPSLARYDDDSDDESLNDNLSVSSFKKQQSPNKKTHKSGNFRFSIGGLEVKKTKVGPLVTSSESDSDSTLTSFSINGSSSSIGRRNKGHKSILPISPERPVKGIDNRKSVGRLNVEKPVELSTNSSSESDSQSKLTPKLKYRSFTGSASKSNESKRIPSEFPKDSQKQHLEREVDRITTSLGVPNAGLTLADVTLSSSNAEHVSSIEYSSMGHERLSLHQTPRTSQSENKKFSRIIDVIISTSDSDEGLKSSDNGSSPSLPVSQNAAVSEVGCQKAQGSKRRIIPTKLPSRNPTSPNKLFDSRNNENFDFQPSQTPRSLSPVCLRTFDEKSVGESTLRILQSSKFHSSVIENRDLNAVYDFESELSPIKGDSPAELPPRPSNRPPASNLRSSRSYETPSSQDTVKVSQPAKAKQSTLPKKKKRKSKVEDKNEIPRLPDSLTRSIFEEFSLMPVTDRCLQKVQSACDYFWEQLADNLDAFSDHASRDYINREDVELYLYKVGVAKDRNSLNALIEKYLPYEMRRALIPMALAKGVKKP